MASPADPLVAATGDTTVMKSGVIKKRSGRMHQWTSRFFVLSESKISYKLKQDAQLFKCSYDLTPGCIVTEVQVESRIQGKKLYSFWIVWPHDKTKDDKEREKERETERDKDNSDEERETLKDFVPCAAEDEKDRERAKAKDLKQIVESEVMTMKRQRSLVEEQIELHHARDNNVSLGAKVAAVAVGGVVVGALTAGIGLIPYITVVGITAVAGGGAVAWQWRRPLDSRLIMACDTMQEAIDWKQAIEHQISRIEDNLKPALPPTVNPRVISTILERATLGGSWRRVTVCEQMSILEHVLPKSYFKDHKPQSKLAFLDLEYFNPYTGFDDGTPYSSANHEFVNDAGNEACRQSVKTTRCRRAQLAVGCTPINTFLSLMNGQHWPKHGSFKVVKEIDDHADVVGVEVTTDCKPYGGKHTITRKLCFSRFWTLDDDGVYLITYNSTVSEEFPSDFTTGAKELFKAVPPDDAPTIDAVISIAPRVDCSNYEYDIAEAMITCHCQASTKGNWAKGEMIAFMDNFLKGHLLELKYALTTSKYFMQPAVDSLQDFPRSSTTASTTFSEKEITKTSSSDALPPTPQLSRSRSKRGVTTIQPGAEDIQDFDDKRSVTSDAPSIAIEGRSPSAKSKSVLGLFGRKKIASHDDRPKSPPLKLDVVSPARGESPSDRQKKRLSSEIKKRDKSTNSEANLLRSQIAATEYELQRLAKTMRKKTIVNPPPLSGGNSNNFRIEKHQITSTEYSVMQDQQSDLQRKLQLLRQRHVELTGETYDQSKAHRSTLSRFRSIGAGKRLDSDILIESPTKTKSEGASLKGKHHARPSHWMNFTRKDKTSSWILVFPSLLVSLLKPSFWGQFLLASFNHEEDKNAEFKPSALREKYFQESVLVMIVIFLFIISTMYSASITAIFVLN